MITFTYTLVDEQGIHARPAGLLVAEMKKFTSTVTMKKGDKTADAKKLFAVMKLAAKQGEEIVFSVEGEDETEAAACAKGFMQDNL